MSRWFKSVAVTLRQRIIAPAFWAWLAVATVGYFTVTRVVQDWLYRGFQRPADLFESFGPKFIDPEPLEIPLYLLGYAVIPLLALALHRIAERWWPVIRANPTARWMLVGLSVVAGAVIVALLPWGRLVDFSVGRYPVLLVVRDSASHISTDEVVITVTGGLTFLRGDSNNDGAVDISDAINTLGYLFTSAGKVTCQDAADANDDGEVDISDAIFTLGYLFLGTPPTLPQPHPTRGRDPTIDAIGCDSYAP